MDNHFFVKIKIPSWGIYFSLVVNALVYVWHRPGHSLGKTTNLMIGFWFLQKMVVYSLSEQQRSAAPWNYFFWIRLVSMYFHPMEMEYFGSTHLKMDLLILVWEDGIHFHKPLWVWHENYSDVENFVLLLPCLKSRNTDWRNDKHRYILYRYMHYVRFSQFYWHFEILNRKTGYS